MKRTFVLAVAACAFFLPVDAVAQVGHAPESSPYKNLQANKWFSAHGGYQWGDAGSAGVGPHNGPLAGIRLDFGLTGALDVFGGMGASNLERLLIDPTQGVEDRVLGTARQTVFMFDAGIALRLTGAKTWKGLLPYAGLSLGLAVGTEVPEDSLSGFDFGLQFQTGPQVGVRLHATRRVFLKLEGRAIVWRLSYPSVFFEPPANDPTSPPVLNPLTMGGNEWTFQPMVMIGLGYGF